MQQSRVTMKESQVYEMVNIDPNIYNLPKNPDINARVLCKLYSVSVVCFIFLIGEVIGGIMASSLAIISDAAHMFSDLSGFFISIISIHLA